MTDREAMENIAANVKRLREDADWSLSEAARRCTTKQWKCYPATIEQIETMQHHPRAGMLARVAAGLGVTTDALLAKPQHPHKRRRLAKAS